ncbi:ionotropic receptor 93a-like [Eriocheir sinensis]|uniref:ionotropic receptor 93a-like n=1 Tax=Eriocheir sinensis TaxID=95602 RepID=UPI0021C8E182|nr:ionotropic receptor 93a-like [Eriocheir sinensis]
MGSLKTLAVLSVVLAATEHGATTARAGGLPSQRRLQLATYRTTYSYLRPPGGCTLSLQNQTTTQEATWSSNNDTKPRRHKVWSRDDMHVKRKKRSLLPGIEEVRENGTTDRNPGHPLGKTADVLSFSHLMTAMAHQLRDCELVLAYDDHYNDPRVLAGVLALPNVKQVVHVGTIEDFGKLVWVSPGCRGYFLLLHRTDILLTFLDIDRDAWDYDGRFVVTASLVSQLEAMSRTDKGRKTEHLLGIVKSLDTGEWRLYINQLYVGEGVRPLTTWRAHSFTSQPVFFPDKLSDLRGVTLRTVTFAWEPSIMYQRAPNGTVVHRFGVDTAVVRLIGHAMNFSVRFDEPADGELWGRQKEDGSWTGVMGALDRDEADMGVANLFLSYKRIGVVDFSTPHDFEVGSYWCVDAHRPASDRSQIHILSFYLSLYSFRRANDTTRRAGTMISMTLELLLGSSLSLCLQESCFLVRREPPLPRWLALSFPFHWGTWIAILVGLLVSGPLLYVLTLAGGKWCEKEEMVPFSEDNTEVKASLASDWLGTFAFHLRETHPHPPTRGSTQVFVSFLWLYTMILTIAYGTNLTAFLLVNKLPASIQTLEELAESNFDVMGVGIIFSKLLSESSDPNVKVLAANYKSVETKDEAVNRVLKGRAVFLENQGFVEFVAHTKFLKDGVGRTRVMEECFAPHYIAIGLQRRTPLKRKVDEVITWVQQSGLIRHSFLSSLRMAASIERASSETEAVGETDEGNLTALNLDHLQGAFLILLVGFLLAVLASLAERVLISYY